MAICIRRVAALVSLAVLASVVPAGAHDATGESVVIELNDQRAMVTALVPFEALGYRDTSGDGLIDVSEIEAQAAGQASKLVEIVRANATIRIDGPDAQIIAAGVAPVDADSEEPAASPYVMLGLVSGPHDGDVSELSLDWLFDSPSSSVVLSHAEGVTQPVSSNQQSRCRSSLRRSWPSRAEVVRRAPSWRWESASSMAWDSPRACRASAS